MHTQTPGRSLRGPSVLGPLLGACLLAACGGSEPDVPVPAPQAVSSSSSSSRASVSARSKAVAIQSGVQAMSLEFELQARPVPGEALDITLYLTGVDDATELQLAVSSDKLQVLDGAEAKFAALKVGEPLEHHVKVRSDVVGVMIADVRIQALVASKPKTLLFSIPMAFLAPDTP